MSQCFCLNCGQEIVIGVSEWRDGMPIIRDCMCKKSFEEHKLKEKQNDIEGQSNSETKTRFHSARAECAKTSNAQNNSGINQ